MSDIYFIVDNGAAIKVQNSYVSLGHVIRNQTYMMVVFHDIWSMCCVYIRNVQHQIDPAVLKAARKEILVFHIREQLRLR